MLLFEQLKIDHDGHYICQACLRKEFVESVEVRLTVKMAGSELPPLHVLCTVVPPFMSVSFV